MKRMISLLIALAMSIFLCACEGSSASTFEVENVSVQVPIYDIVEESRGSSMPAIYEYTYDEEGRILTQRATQDSHYLRTYEYNDQDQITRMTEVSEYFQTEGDQSIYTYTYNETGQVSVLTTQLVEADGSSGTFLDGSSISNTYYSYEFDDLGRVSKEIMDVDGYIGETEYEYDAANRVIQSTETIYRDGYTGGVSEVYSNSYTFDAFGFMISETSYDTHEGDAYTHSWSYAPTGTITWSASTGEFTESANWIALEDYPSLPSPDSMLTALAGSAVDSESYAVLLPSEAKDASLLFFAYCQALADLCNFSVDITPSDEFLSAEVTNESGDVMAVITVTLQASSGSLLEIK